MGGQKGPGMGAARQVAGAKWLRGREGKGATSEARAARAPEGWAGLGRAGQGVESRVLLGTGERGRSGLKQGRPRDVICISERDSVGPLGDQGGGCWIRRPWTRR